MSLRAKIKRWLLQLGLRPRLLLLGFASEAVFGLLKEIGVEHISIRNPRVELAEIWRRVTKCQGIVLLSDIDEGHRSRVRDAFSHVSISSVKEAGKEEEAILSVLETMIIESDPQSNRKPNEKDQRMPGHHTPRGYQRYNHLCEAICDLPQVTRIRYFKYAGRELEVGPWPETPEDPASRIDLRVRTTDRCGVVVSIACDHPVHVASTKVKLEALLAHYNQ